MGFGKQPDVGEPEPYARHSALACYGTAIEFVENPAAIAFGDAVSVIGDRYFGTVLSQRAADFYLYGLAGVFYGVFDKVHDHLRQMERIADDLRSLRYVICDFHRFPG